jgi:hypothetical protein
MRKLHEFLAIGDEARSFAEAARTARFRPLRRRAARLAGFEALSATVVECAIDGCRRIPRVRVGRTSTTT